MGCFRIGTIIHEIMHALGFDHMHTASNRDDYVRIMWENILRGTEENFDMYEDYYGIISMFGYPYDIGSVMHYNAFSATKNGFATIIPHVSLLII